MIRGPIILPAFGRGLIGALLVFGFLAGPVQAQGNYRLQADGLACPFCAYGIEKQLSSINGVESVATDIKSGTVTVTTQDGTVLDEDTARRAVEAAGFTMRSFKSWETGK